MMDNCSAFSRPNPCKNSGAHGGISLVFVVLIKSVHRVPFVLLKQGLKGSKWSV